MNNIESVQREIKETEQAIKPLAEKLDRLTRQLADMQSREFIAVNKITLADVEMSAGVGKPFFGDVRQFTDWMKLRAAFNAKPWAEWNGFIYHASDLLAGRMPDMPGRIRDLEPKI
jgi:glutathione S-transferase